MWFPNWFQWVVIWIGFFFTAGASVTDGWSVAAFVAVGTVLIVWMIEGYRRKRKSNETT
jgi:steroid 5-alpha reductase family enzyme